ncbi:aconitate hydratase B, partial [Klebsiella pneumoniae]|nr:aconitate hydratase B [Klebsiella pneumoniae]
DRVPPGVDQAAYVKATFLSAIAHGETTSPLIMPVEAVELLGTMIGGYNVAALIDLLKSADVAIATAAVAALSKTLLVYDAYNDVVALAETNAYAQQVLESWAKAEWFTSKPTLPEAITV